MIHLGVHVRVEPVLACAYCDQVWRLRFLEADADQALRGLDPYFQERSAGWGAVLIGQRLAVEPDGQQRERMRGSSMRSPST